MNRRTILLLVITFAGLGNSFISAETTPFRPPAVPLVTSDPYLSIWSRGDRLTDVNTSHWTGQDHPLVSLIRIDGKAYRLMGKDPDSVPAFPQVGLQVTATRSIYDFDDGHVHVTLTFLTPALPDQLEILARPLTYLTWDVHAVDGKKHNLSIYDSTSSLLTVAQPTQSVTWGRVPAGDLTVLKCGSIVQNLFEPGGDRVRIDWGYAYAAAPSGQAKACVGMDDGLEKNFVAGIALPARDEVPPTAASPGFSAGLENPPAGSSARPHATMAFVFDLGPVDSESVSRHLMIAYDELYEIDFSGQKLPPYWKRNGASAVDLLKSAEKDYAGLIPQCEDFDHRLASDMTQAGGAEYAQIGALAYRQALAGCGLAADANKQPLLFTKENTSNGDIATVDVITPASPIFLFLSPTLAKALVVPPLAYAASDRWKFPNAPHDLGSYPDAAATGAAGEAMPVEESGNLIILCDAIAKIDNNADFVAPWWPKLTQWAGFLEKYGLDPENQLCTDDFMGHLAHNANLSIKAIVALGAYGDLCQRRGDQAGAKKYFDLAQADARHWVEASKEGDHYRIAFDQPGTWSIKYNLVWDKVLGLHIFPPKVAQQEIAYYKTRINTFGVPLDSRTLLGDTDHMIFTASLADDRADFEALVKPFYDFLTQTTHRQPLVDTYLTKDVNSGRNFARPVVGGVFMRMLTDADLWKKWATANTSKPGPWAPIPPKPVMTTFVPTDPKASLPWRYTATAPASDWTSPSFDDSSWTETGGNVPPADPKHPTNGPEADAWRRITLTLPARLPPNLQWIVQGAGCEIYVNGVLAGVVSKHRVRVTHDVFPEALSQLKPGAKVAIAVHSFGSNDGHIDVALGAVAVPQAGPP